MFHCVLRSPSTITRRSRPDRPRGRLSRAKRPTAPAGDGGRGHLRVGPVHHVRRARRVADHSRRRCTRRPPSTAPPVEPKHQDHPAAAASGDSRRGPDQHHQRLQQVPDHLGDDRRRARTRPRRRRCSCTSWRCRTGQLDTSAAMAVVNLALVFVVVLYLPPCLALAGSDPGQRDRGRHALGRWDQCPSRGH